ncbi:MAG: ABC transporter permease [Spirochaetaceae bacterium]|nr:ABC transporter permease [Spirochaetaceae bacterium]
MKLKASILFAFRMLKPRSGIKTSAGRSLLGAVFCIGLSLVPLIVVLTVSDGMIEGITSRIIELSSYHMQVSVRSSSSLSKSASALSNLANEIAQVPGVTAAYPERQGVALAAGPTGRTGVTVRAVPPEMFTSDSSFRNLFATKEGSASLSSARSALIGTQVASTLNIKAGDTIRLVTFRTGINGNIIPRITPFTVEGVISCGYQELDALWVFIPFETGYSLLSGGTSTMCVGIQTADAFSDSFMQIALEVEQIVPAGCRLYLWNELNTAKFENYASTKMMLIFIMFLILLVASVNVSSALVMLAMERRREIAILKSMGANSGGVVTSFLITGFCTGAAGVLIGLPLGILCAVNVNEILSFIENVVNILAKFWYNFTSMFSVSVTEFVPVQLLNPALYLEHIPVVLPLKELLLVAAGTLILSVVVSAFPSIKAGAEKPIDTLRKV